MRCSVRWNPMLAARGGCGIGTPWSDRVETKPIDTTLYSFADRVPSPPEARADERHLTLFRVGAMIIGDRRELCLIKNVSASGMMVRTYSTMTEGRPVSVELKQGQLVHGHVRWVREFNVGIAFDERIDVVDLLSASMDGPRPRMPRVEVNCAAAARQGSTQSSLKVHDVSQGGIKAEASRSLETGEDIVVTLPGMPPMHGIVRWRDGAIHGISFNRLLALSELVEWLHGQREALAG
jgi:hypothetical protein